MMHRLNRLDGSTQVNIRSASCMHSLQATKNWSHFFICPEITSKNMKDSLEPDIIVVVSTLRYLCRKIRGREAAMLALNLRLDEIICEILRIFPGHAGIRKWGWGVLWSLSYPKESWCPSSLSMASPVRSWRNIGGSWVVCRQRKISKRRRGISRVYRKHNRRLSRARVPFE